MNVKSTYESPEERAKRQILIVRQSALDRAVTTLSVGAKTPPGYDDVTTLATKYYNWVMQDPAEVVSQDVFSLPNDIEVE